MQIGLGRTFSQFFFLRKADSVHLAAHSADVKNSSTHAVDRVFYLRWLMQNNQRQCCSASDQTTSSKVHCLSGAVRQDHSVQTDKQHASGVYQPFRFLLAATY